MSIPPRFNDESLNSGPSLLLAPVSNTIQDPGRSSLLQPIKHVKLKWRNNRIESDHAALKPIVNLGKGFNTMRSAKSTLLAIEAFRTIKRGHVFQPPENPAAEIRLMNDMFGIIS